MSTLCARTPSSTSRPRRAISLGPPKSGNDFLLPCPADTADKKHFCRKIYQNVRGDERVIRSCGWIKDERERACYSTVLEEYNTDVCACDNEDGCNSERGRGRATQQSWRSTTQMSALATMRMVATLREGEGVLLNSPGGVQHRCLRLRQ